MSEFHGDCFGVRIIKRDDCPNDMVQLLIEDDDNWFEAGSPFDAGWIDDLILTLRSAQKIAKVRFQP